MWFLIPSATHRRIYIRGGGLGLALLRNIWGNMSWKVALECYNITSPSSSLVFSPKAGFGRNQEPSQATGMALAHCILGSFLGVDCHCFPPPLDVPTFTSRCLHVQATWETSIRERRNYGREMAGQFCLWFRLPRKPRVLWHAAQICDMGDGFTSPPPKEDILWIFFARKIRRLRPGSNPRSWVPEASMLTTRPPKPLWKFTINRKEA